MVLLVISVYVSIFAVLFKKKTVFILMLLNSEAKKNLFTKFGKDAANTGSAEAQIAMFTERINHLTDHLKVSKKDYSTQRALIRLVGKRRSLLDYLQKTEIGRYRSIISELGIRK